MSRPLVQLRSAGVEDALFLAEVWADALRRGDRQEQLSQVLPGWDSLWTELEAQNRIAGGL